MGYLTFRLYAVCVFCVIVFGFLITLGTLRLIAREYEVIAGFAALAAVFTLLYLVLPVGITSTLPENGRFLLFYSKDCKYCDETKTQLEKEKIPVIYLEANAYRGFLKGLGIEHVPTLVVNDRYEKAVFVGQEAIKRYLLACSRAQHSETRPRETEKAGTADSLMQINNDALKWDIFTHGDVMSHPDDTASNGGRCKQEEICK
jgi:glutaredoxin